MKNLFNNCCQRKNRIGKNKKKLQNENLMLNNGKKITKICKYERPLWSFSIEKNKMSLKFLNINIVHVKCTNDEKNVKKIIQFNFEDACL